MVWADRIQSEGWVDGTLIARVDVLQATINQVRDAPKGDPRSTRRAAMTDAPKPLVTKELVARLAQLTSLGLDGERCAAVAVALDGLLRDANEVNRLMEARRDVGLAVRVHHPHIAVAGEEEL